MKENKSSRTRQIQFRMDPDKVKRLYATIAYDDNMHSMADLFNQAADEYLKKHEKVLTTYNKQNNDSKTKTHQGDKTK